MKWHFFILFLFLAAGCSRPQGFTLRKILSEHQSDPRWEVATPKGMDEIRSFLREPYTYLGSGNHCYAFVSANGEHVLKFFKQKHMRTKTMLDYLPNRLRRRRKEREESFSSYKIAYQQLQNETGVIFLHLNKTVNLLPTCALFDQHGTPLEIKLDEMEFLLQRRATLAFEYLESLFGHKDHLLDAIESLLRLVALRSQKGVYDKDLQFYKNFGFRDGEAMEVDVGELRLDQAPRETVDEVREVSLQICDFIHENAPMHLSDVQIRINSILRTL